MSGLNVVMRGLNLRSLARLVGQGFGINRVSANRRNGEIAMNWRMHEHGSFLIEKDGCVHYVAGARIRRSERGPYMKQLVSAAKAVLAYRRDLKRRYPHACFNFG